MPGSTDTVYAPWTPEQVALLNEFQALGVIHPFTCGSGNRMDEKHLDGKGVLVAKKDGWHCPYCDYRQNWAIGFMCDAVAIQGIKGNRVEVAGWGRSG